MMSKHNAQRREKPDSLRRSPRFFVISRDKNANSLIRQRLSRNGCVVDVFENPILSMFAFKIDYYNYALIDMSIGVKSAETNCFELHEFINKLDRKVRIGFITKFEVNQKEFLKVFPSKKACFFLNKEEIGTNPFEWTPRHFLNLTEPA